MESVYGEVCGECVCGEVCGECVCGEVCGEVWRIKWRNKLCNTIAHALFAGCVAAD